MTAFAIATVTVKNPEKMQQYGASAGQTIAAHGGELLIRGAFAKSLTGNGEAHMKAIIKFPDMDALDAWYASDAYQAIIPLRNEACDMAISAYAVPE